MEEEFSVLMYDREDRDDDDVHVVCQGCHWHRLRAGEPCVVGTCTDPRLHDVGTSASSQCINPAIVYFLTCRRRQCPVCDWGTRPRSPCKTRAVAVHVIADATPLVRHLTQGEFVRDEEATPASPRRGRSRRRSRRRRNQGKVRKIGELLGSSDG